MDAQLTSNNIHNIGLKAPIAAGVVIFHRSGDKEVGLHGNSGLSCPSPESHRIAIIFYLTTLHLVSKPDPEPLGQEST